MSKVFENRDSAVFELGAKLGTKNKLTLVEGYEFGFEGEPKLRGLPFVTVNKSKVVVHYKG